MSELFCTRNKCRSPNACGTCTTNATLGVQVLDDLVERLPELFDMEDIRGRVDEFGPYVMVAIQVRAPADSSHIVVSPNSHHTILTSTTSKSPLSQFCLLPVMHTHTGYTCTVSWQMPFWEHTLYFCAQDCWAEWCRLLMSLNSRTALLLTLTWLLPV